MHEGYPDTLEPIDMRNARDFTIWVAWGPWSQSGASERQSGWTRNRRMGRAAAGGNVTGRLNQHCQCEFEPAARRARRCLVSTASHPATAFSIDFL